MRSYFETEQEALEYKEKHQLYVMTTEYREGFGWMLLFPIKGHLSVDQDAHAEFRKS